MGSPQLSDTPAILGCCPPLTPHSSKMTSNFPLRVAGEERLGARTGKGLRREPGGKGECSVSSHLNLRRIHFCAMQCVGWRREHGGRWEPSGNAGQGPSTQLLAQSPFTAVTKGSQAPLAPPVLRMHWHFSEVPCFCHITQLLQVSGNISQHTVFSRMECGFGSQTASVQLLALQ